MDQKTLGGSVPYGLDVSNVTDNSERLRITHVSNTGGAMGGYKVRVYTTTWINVTTGHSRANIIDLPGTVVLSYDVSAPADACWVQLVLAYT